MGVGQHSAIYLNRNLVPLGKNGKEWEQTLYRQLVQRTFCGSKKAPHVDIRFRETSREYENRLHLRIDQDYPGLDFVLATVISLP